jgi:SecD/SecF fusion protein
MKIFKYFIISIVIALTMTSAFPQATGNPESMTLQSNDKNAGTELLKKSADIISTRLKLLGFSTFEVTVSAEKKQIRIQLPVNTDIAEIEGLVTANGELSFYETYTHDEIAQLLKPDNQLFKLLKSDQLKGSADPRVGCANSEQRKKTEEYLNTGIHMDKCKLFWGSKSENSEYCLFALRTNEDGKPLMTRSDVDSVNIINGNDPQDRRIQIKLKNEAIRLFADATKKNLNRSIAIVIDNKVYSWPVVKSIIKGGKIEVSGSFTEKEVKYFPALFNSEKLPLSLTLLK